MGRARPLRRNPTESHAHARELYRQLSDDGRAFGGPGPSVVDERVDGQTLYRLEHVRCGKRGCWCASSYPRRGHGPYWYAYWRDDEGTRRSMYIGKVPRTREQAAEIRRKREAKAAARQAAAERAQRKAAEAKQHANIEAAAAWDGRPMSRTAARRMLGVDERASSAEIRSAYRRLAAVCHPDRARSERERARLEHVMKALNAARRTLLS